MIGKYCGCGREAEVIAVVTTNAIDLRVHSGEKLFDQGIDFLSGRSEQKRATLEKLNAKSFFELFHLSADRRLLDAVGHVVGRTGYAFEFGYVVEQLKVMNIDVIHEDGAGEAVTVGYLLIFIRQENVLGITLSLSNLPIELC